MMLVLGLMLASAYAGFCLAVFLSLTAREGPTQ